jgi:hypothetical protein
MKGWKDVEKAVDSWEAITCWNRGFSCSIYLIQLTFCVVKSEWEDLTKACNITMQELS